MKFIRVSTYVKKLLYLEILFQTSMLAERMTRAQTVLEEAIEHPGRMQARHTEADTLPETPSEHLAAPEKEENVEPKEEQKPKKNTQEEKEHRRKVVEFYKFMNVISHDRTLSEIRLKMAIMEKLVALQNDFEGDLSQNTAYWNMVRGCRGRDETDVRVFECGHKIFGDYIELVNPEDPNDFRPPTDFDDDFDDEPLELLDESTIENYVEDGGNHDSSEL